MLMWILLVAFLSVASAQESRHSSTIQPPSPLTTTINTTKPTIERTADEGHGRPVPYTSFQANPSADFNSADRSSSNPRRSPAVEYRGYDSRTNEPSNRFNNPRSLQQPSTRTSDRQPSQPGPLANPNQPIDGEDYTYRSRTPTDTRRTRTNPDTIPDDISFKPYAFNYVSDAEDGYYSHQQSSDDSGRVIGSYSFVLDDGRKRVVEYIADQNGFRANIDSNEPGMNMNENPADVVYYSDGNQGRSQSDARRSPQPGHHAPSLTVYNRFGEDTEDGNRISARQPLGGVRRPIYNAPGRDSRFQDQPEPSDNDEQNPGVVYTSGNLNVSGTVPTGRDDSRIPPFSRDNTRIPSSGRDDTRIPSFGRDNTRITSSGRDDTRIPSLGRDDTRIPSSRRDDTRIPLSRRDDTRIPSSGRDDTRIPSYRVNAADIPSSVPQNTRAGHEVPSYLGSYQPGPAEASFFGSRRFDAGVPDTRNPEVRVPIPMSPAGVGLNYSPRILDEQDQQGNDASRPQSTRRLVPNYPRIPESRSVNLRDQTSSEASIPEYNPQGLNEQGDLNARIPSGRQFVADRPNYGDSRIVPGEYAATNPLLQPRYEPNEERQDQDSWNTAPRINPGEPRPLSADSPATNYRSGDDRQSAALPSMSQNPRVPLVEYHQLHPDGDQPYFYSFDNGNYWFHRH